MSSSVVTTNETKQVARPLKALVLLIKDDLQHGDEAAKNAAMPYYRAAGEKLLEAKDQLAHGEFENWVRRNFAVKLPQARIYMKLAAATPNKQNGAPGAPFSSIDDFRRRHLGHDRVPGSRRDAAWQEPIKESIQKAQDQAVRLRDETLSRQQERDAEKRLAMQLIDIGFKALASKLHPDKGGSRDAMARLNRVRDRLKQHA